MLINLLMGLPTMVVCLLLQALLLVKVIHYYGSRRELIDSPSFWSSLAVVSMVMLLLVIGNLAQVSIWATGLDLGVVVPAAG
jgi:hypothetical protein